MKKNKVGIIVTFFFLTVFSFIPVLWFKKPGFMINGVDTNFPLNPYSWLVQRLFVWNGNLNAGVDHSASISGIPFHSLQSIIFFFGFNVVSTEMVTLVIWFALGIFSCYFLFYVIDKVYFSGQKNIWKEKLVRLIGVSVYTFNLYQMDVWKNVKVANLMLLIALPVVLGLFILTLEKKISSKIGAAISALLIIILSGIGLNPAYFLILLLSIFLFFAVAFFYGKGDRKYILNSSLFFALTLILASAFWLVPVTLNVTGITGDRVTNIRDLGIENWLLGLSKNTSVFMVLRMLGAWDWYELGLRKLPYVPFAEMYFTKPFFIVWSILLPVITFCGVFYSNKNKITIYAGLVLIVGVIFATGAHSPFGGIYLFLHHRLPLFSLFRSPWYIFTPLIVLSYSLLVFIFWQYLSARLKNTVIFSILSILFVVGNLFFASPLINGDIFRPHQTVGTYYVKIPQYVYDSKKFLGSLTHEERILNLPFSASENYIWGYSGVTPLIQLLSKVSVVSPIYGKNSQGFISEIGKEIEKRIVRNDTSSIEEIFALFSIKHILNKSDQFDKTTISKEKFNDEYLDLENKKTFKDWVFYPVKGEINSHFWIPEKKIWVDGQANDLINIAKLESVSRSQFTFSSEVNSVSENINKYDSIYVSPDCIKCNLTPDQQEELPYVRFLPGSIFYKFIEWKEVRQKEKIKDPVEVYHFSLLLAEKRLSELKGFVDTQSSNANAINKTFVRFQEEINNCKNALSEAEKQGRNVNNERTELAARLKFFSNYFRYFIVRQLPTGVHDYVKTAAFFIEQTRVKVSEKTIATKSVNDKKFQYSIPTDGNYSIVVFKDSNIEKYFNNKLYNTDFRVEVDGSEVVQSRESTKTVQFVPKFHKSGNHILSINFNSPENLIPIGNRSVLDVFANEFVVSRSFVTPYLLPTYEYLLSFNYKVTTGISAKLVIDQVGGNEFEKEDVYRDYELGKNESWTNFSVLVRPNKGENRIRLTFHTIPDPVSGSLELKDLSFKLNYNPEVLLVKNNGESDYNKHIRAPKISNERISAVEYIVNVENASKPFPIIFQEGFHKGWYAEIDGKIIPKENHTLVNGYANMWKIEKQGDYSIKIYYMPQYLFLAGVVISAIVVCVSISIIFFYLFQRLKR